VTTLFGAAHVENLIPVPLWRGGLIYLIGGPVMAVTLGGLALWNYKRVLVGWPVWRRNLGVLAFALVAVTSLTTAIYQRVWELFGRLEPAHGAPRLAEATGVHLDLLGQRISAWSPEGRAWSAWLDFEKSDISAALTGGLYAPAPIAAGRFLEGTNWVSVAFGLEDVMASHSDGSLWVSEGADAGRRFREDQSQHPVKLKRHGSDHDWMSLVANWMSVLAVKSDGTLWRIGTNRFSKRPWPGWRGFEPYRLDTETNWAEVFSLGDRTAFRKTDGRFYVSPPYTANPSERLKLDDETTLEHVSYLEQNRWRGLTSVYGVYGGFAAVIQVGVAEDGRLYVLSGFRDPFRPPAEPAVLGQETNWIAVVGNYGQTVTLKSDGTLWVWHFPENPVTDPQSAYATQLGEHSDWRAVMEAGDGIIALAADGSLWSWRFIPRGTPHFWSLLRPTRHPRLLGNIFAPAQ
jgi:hypothetical protein